MIFNNNLNVVPAKAGIQPASRLRRIRLTSLARISTVVSCAADAARWVPAFTGTTILVCLFLSACGIKGDLVRPSDIARHEQEKKERELKQSQ